MGKSTGMLMIAVVSLCILLVFAACAGGDNDKTPTPAATSIALVLPTPPPPPWDRVPCDSKNRYTFSAYADGYDTRVGSGFVLLKAGYSYTFELKCKPEQVEVRLISNDQLLGYALLIATYGSNGSFHGYEKPIAIVDSNGDDLVSIQELDTALGLLREEVKVIAASQPSFAAKFEADIASAYAAKNGGAIGYSIADAYRKIKQLRVEVAYVEQAAKAH